MEEYSFRVMYFSVFILCVVMVVIFLCRVMGSWNVDKMFFLGLKGWFIVGFFYFLGFRMIFVCCRFIILVDKYGFVMFFWLGFCFIVIVFNDKMV